MASITSANSVFMLAIVGLFPAPQRLQGFAAEAAFETEAADIAEIVRGVDGVMSYGFVPYNTRMTISIMPDSATSSMFETWIQAEKAAGEKLPAEGTISLPATSRRYVLTTGILSNVVSVPAARRVLQARQFIITWGDISPLPTL